MRVSILVMTRLVGDPKLELAAFDVTSAAVRWVEKEIGGELPWKSKFPGTFTADDGNRLFKIVELEVDGE